jgi:hypothetical protein
MKATEVRMWNKFWNETGRLRLHALGDSQAIPDRSETRWLETATALQACNLTKTQIEIVTSLVRDTVLRHREMVATVREAE